MYVPIPSCHQDSLWPDVIDACPQRHLHPHCFCIPALFSSTFWTEKEQLYWLLTVAANILSPAHGRGPSEGQDSSAGVRLDSAVWWYVSPVCVCCTLSF